MNSKTIIVDAQGIEMFMLVDPDAEPVKVPNEITMVVSTGKDGVIFQSPPPTVVGNMLPTNGLDDLIRAIRESGIDLDQEEPISGKIIYDATPVSNKVPPHRNIIASHDNVINQNYDPNDQNRIRSARVTSSGNDIREIKTKGSTPTLDQLLENASAKSKRRV